MNNVALTGRIGSDPRTHTFDNGGIVSSFSIAVDDGYFNKAKNEWINQTVWINISVPRETKALKGDLVEVVGKLSVREYEKDDSKRIFTEVRTSSMRLLHRKSNEAPVVPSINQDVKSPDTVTAPPKPEGDLPF